MDLIGAWRLRTTGNFYTDLYLRAGVNWQSTDLNRSSVHTQLSIYQSAYSYTTDSWSAGLTGTQDKSGGRTTFSAGETVIATGDFEVAHNADGTGSATIYCWVSQTWGGSLSGLSANYALPTIPRATTPNCKDGIVGQALTINTPRASDKFKHIVSYWFGESKGTIATDVETSCTWKIPMDLEKQIPNASYGTGTITCDTYNGGTKIGSKSCSVRIYASSVPSINDLICTEINSYVAKKGKNITVQGISKKTISCKVTAQNGASVSSVNVNGTNLIKGNNNVWSVTIGNPQNGKYVITAKDSRGRTSSQTIQETYYEYSAPQFTEGTLVRENETSSNGKLTVKAKYATTLSNSCTMTLQRNDSSASTSVEVSQSSGSLSFEKDYTDLFYTVAWAIVVRLTDSFGITAETTVRLGMGRYSFALSKEGAIIPDSSQILHTDTGVLESIIDYIYPVGVCVQFANEFNPNEHFKGTQWTRVEGKYFYNAPLAGGTLLSTFGDGWFRDVPNHALTQGQMPIHYHPQYVSANYGSGGSGVRRDFIDEGGGLSAYAQGISTGGAGGNESHNHGSIDISPPSIRVRGWYRTA